MKVKVKSSGQTRTGAFVEAWFNVIVGYVINISVNLMLLPAFGYDITVHDAMSIGLIFTVISVIRSYFIRRLFNHK